MKRLYKISLGLVFALSASVFFAGCDSLTELDTLDNPNALTPGAADADLFLNQIQIDVAAFFMSDNTDNFDGASEIAAEVTRMLHMFGPTYTNAYAPANFNEIWEDAYSDILIDVRNMNVLAVEGELFTHLAIGQIIEAYVLMTLVDFWGDVPYTEALQGAANLEPSVDSGADVYAVADGLLLAAIENLGLTPIREPGVDFYYGGDKAAWINLANTLRIKMYTNTRLVDAAESNSVINTILTSGNYITTSDGDWAFQYSTVDNNPDSRHPWYSDNYDVTLTSADYYMSNYYMDLLAEGTNGTSDPRIRYYIYRQESDFSEANFQTKPCVLELTPTHYEADDPFCTVTGGYWGRDHGDDDGIPPDAQFRATFGVYPIGGLFDDGSAATVDSRALGLQGAGIAPMMMSSFVDFYLAEGALLGGVTGDPATYLENGITKSMNTVTAFGAAEASGPFVPDATAISDYIQDVMDEYNAAGNDDDRMQIIAEQLMIAAWGNGIEAYNLYRRTGFPNDLQPTLLEAPGDFIRSFRYPAVSVDNNPSITQKANQSVQVFWDTNPAGFID